MKSQNHKKIKNAPPVESAKRARILEVASQMFVAQGYSAVSMDALAEAAPVSKPTLYKHFKDKKALFTAVMVTRCNGLFDMFDQTLKDDSRQPAEILKLAAANFLGLILSPQTLALHRIIVAESQNFPELGQMFYENGPKKVMALLSAWLEQQHKSGTLVVENPDLAASLFLNMVKTELHLQCLLGLRKNVSQKDRERVAEYATTMFIKAHRP